MKRFFQLVFLLLPTLTWAQDISLTEQERLAFQKMAQEKVNTLGNALHTLCDKTESEDSKETAMILALKLFIDDHQTVETSSRTTHAVHSELIGIYLNRLRSLNYTQVEVDWYDIRYASELKKGRDGKYYATMTIFQKFTGFGADGKILYQDVTQKNIDIAMDTEVIRIGDRAFESPTVKLGNIAVVQTE